MSTVGIDSANLDIDIRNVDVFAERMPHDWFTWLRNNKPVYNCAKPGETPIWLITRYLDVMKVSRATDTFSSDASNGGSVGITEEEQAIWSMSSSQGLLFLDPPEHTVYRKIVSGGFTPHVIKRLEDTVRRYAQAVLDAAVAKGRCDFVSDIAVAFPLFAITELVGLPDDWRERCMQWVKVLSSPEDPELVPDASVFFDALSGMYSACEMLMERARKENENVDAVMDLLATARVDDEPLTLERIGAMFVLIFGAGFETTSNALVHGALALSQNPQAYADLGANPELWETAVEEILRWASPVIYMRRTAVKDVELAGEQIRTGDSVVLVYPSANRDESVFDDPFDFDIRRNPNPHVTFGGGGPHFCLGSSLARLEIRVLFEELMKRVSEIKVIDDPERLRSNFLNGIKHLTVDLTPTNA